MVLVFCQISHVCCELSHVYCEFSRYIILRYLMSIVKFLMSVVIFLTCIVSFLTCIVSFLRSIGPGGLSAPTVVADGSHLLFTHSGETPVAENLFLPIFWHNYEEYLKKKIKDNFHFIRRKQLFLRDFLARPAFGCGAWTNP